MKTSKIVIKNLFGIRETTLDGKSVEISGPKGAGKTSVLDAIRFALTNRSERDCIVHQGADEGEIIIETTTGLSIDRKALPAKSAGTVKVRDGSLLQTRPAEFLSQIFTPLQLNPVEFTQLSRQEKNRVILSLIEFDWDVNWIREQFGEIPQGVDYSKHILEVLNDIQAENGVYFQSRQNINRDIRNKQAFISDIAKDIPSGYDYDRWNQYPIGERYLISECYSRDMSMKTKSAKYAKMRRGEYQSVICPYGYRKSADGRMEPDEDVAPNVQMIFQWASEGNTAAEITRKLYAMNIPTPGEYRKLKGKDYYNVSRTNGVWSTSTVLRILEDQRYIGTYVIGKRKVKEIGSRHTQLKDESEWFKIPNHHPAIVSVDLFEKANASIKRFSLSNKKPRDYLLRGKVFCGCCDHAMSLRNGAWFYCRHSEVAETLPCHGVRIKMADLEQVVFETIRAQMCPALGIDSNKDKLDLQTVQQAEHEEKLRSIQDSKRHLYEQYALGEIDLETYRTRKAVYDTELVQAKNVHAVITAQTKQIKSDYEIKLKQQEIVQEVGNANMLTKALIDRLINKVYVFPGDRIEIEYATQDFLETKQSEKEV